MNEKAQPLTSRLILDTTDKFFELMIAFGEAHKDKGVQVVKPSVEGWDEYIDAFGPRADYGQSPSYKARGDAIAFDFDPQDPDKVGMVKIWKASPAVLIRGQGRAHDFARAEKGHDAATVIHVDVRDWKTLVKHFNDWAKPFKKKSWDPGSLLEPPQSSSTAKPRGKWPGTPLTLILSCSLITTPDRSRATGPLVACQTFVLRIREIVRASSDMTSRIWDRLSHTPSSRAPSSRQVCKTARAELMWCSNRS